MWRVEENVFSIEGVMLLLKWHGIYFMTGISIHGIQEVPHLALEEQIMVDLLVD